MRILCKRLRNIIFFFNMKNKILKINEKDTVLIALCDLNRGEKFIFDNTEIELQNDIKAKHKFAFCDFQINSAIIMYGLTVGKATAEIKKGALLTTENVAHTTEKVNSRDVNLNWNAPNIEKWKTSNFLGYYRSDGQVGTLNNWLVIPLVFCENRNILVLKEAFLEALGFAKVNPYKLYVEQMVNQYKQNANYTDFVSDSDFYWENNNEKVFQNIDGVKFLTHSGGCGGTRQDSEMLCRLLTGYINNPNVAGATVLSLGCQNAQSKILIEKLTELNVNKPVYIIDQQEEGTESNLLKKAIQSTFLGLVEANKLERKPASLSKLVIGMECGGSDGFSGISANPTLGEVSDLIVALGGSSILAEFPELCGVEQNIINRCVTNENANKFLKLMTDYSNAAIASGSGFDMNPSPGNIKDGLITDAMKSAGAAKKGGTSPIVDILDYTEYVTQKGLNLLNTPGNDVESTTALAGSGANIILFTTGLGTPTGNPITPVIKVASNTALTEKMVDIIDFNTGTIIQGSKNVQEAGADLLDYIIEVASGKQTTKAMNLDQNDFIPWKRGVSL